MIFINTSVRFGPAPSMSEIQRPSPAKLISDWATFSMTPILLPRSQMSRKDFPLGRIKTIIIGSLHYLLKLQHTASKPTGASSMNSSMQSAIVLQMCQSSPAGGRVKKRGHEVWFKLSFFMVFYKKIL